jgi:hypothetical protein
LQESSIFLPFSITIQAIERNQGSAETGRISWLKNYWAVTKAVANSKHAKCRNIAYSNYFMVKCLIRHFYLANKKDNIDENTNRCFRTAQPPQCTPQIPTSRFSQAQSGLASTRKASFTQYTWVMCSTLAIELSESWGLAPSLLCG